MQNRAQVKVMLPYACISLTSIICTDIKWFCYLGKAETGASMWVSKHHCLWFWSSVPRVSQRSQPPRCFLSVHFIKAEHFESQATDMLASLLTASLPLCKLRAQRTSPLFSFPPTEWTPWKELEPAVRNSKIQNVRAQQWTPAAIFQRSKISLLHVLAQIWTQDYLISRGFFRVIPSILELQLDVLSQFSMANLLLETSTLSSWQPPCRTSSRESTTQGINLCDIQPRGCYNRFHQAQRWVPNQFLEA